MRKLLNNPKVVAILALGAVGFVGYTIWSETNPPARRGTGAPLVQAEPAAAPAEEPLLSETEQASEDGWGSLAALVAKPKRDPFARFRVEQAEGQLEAELPDVEETLQLSALWTQAGATLVLLNGRICRVGDRVGRVSIERVTGEGVWLRHGTGSEFLKVGSRFVLRTPARMLATVSTQ